jgi:transposase
MKTAPLEPIPELSDIPEGERTATVELLLAICHRQQARLQQQAEQLILQGEQIQQLKDEIARLKGEKARPKIKPSRLSKDAKSDAKPGEQVKKKKRRGKPARKKTEELEIHDEQIIEPDHIPPGSEFKGYEPYVVQEIEFKLKNTKYLRARYQTPEGESVVGVLPASVAGGHFGPGLRSYILSQSYQQHVPQKLILKQLWEWGIAISSGQLNRLLIHGHERFHEEKAALLRTGLEVSSHLNVDDTGARHQGKNGYCTHIGNEWFAWFGSTESKSRINFLELLRAGRNDYVVDEVAREYMRQQKLPQGPLALLSQDQVYADQAAWQATLQGLGIVTERHVRIATEGALVGSLVHHGLSPELVIISDDAGQFNIAGFLNALCWVHAERTIHKLIACTEINRKAQETVRDQIWTFYQDLKAYKLNPNENDKLRLEQRFDDIFTQKTAYHSLNLALGRLYDNKAQLLLVLARPDIPLHNNLSENDIRDYVKRRKISATTRSEAGRRARDTFLSLKKTCQKLGISFWHYLQDRISKKNEIPPLPSLIRAAAQGP